MKSYLKYPSWFTTSWKPEEVTDEQIQTWREETDRLKEENFAAYKVLEKKYKDMLALAVEVYGKDSLEFKYLTKNAPQFRISYDFNISVMERVKTARDKVAATKKQTEDAKLKVTMMAEAVIWLKEHGKVLDKDFTMEDAISTADQIAADEEIARLKKSGGMHDFNGQNCDGPCAGWDGESHRCECGNRRVAWSWGWGHSFKKPYVYGEAH